MTKTEMRILRTAARIQFTWPDDTSHGVTGLSAARAFKALIRSGMLRETHALGGTACTITDAGRAKVAP